MIVACDYLADDALDAATLRPGQYARLSAPEFPDGVRDQVALIVSTSCDLRSSVVRVVCWCAVDQSEIALPPTSDLDPVTWEREDIDWSRADINWSTLFA